MTPDYLAVGSDADFVRACIKPAHRAGSCGCVRQQLITARMSDTIYRQAELKQEPQPLTENREAVETFVSTRHHRLAFAGRPAGTFVRAPRRMSSSPTCCRSARTAWPSTAGTSRTARPSSR